MPYPLTYATYQSHVAEASAGEDEVGSVSATKGLLNNACKFFTSAKKCFEDIKKLDPADVYLVGADGACRLEDKTSIEKSKGNMRVALTCWASATKLIDTVKTRKEEDKRSRALIVDGSLSLHFPTLSVK